MKKITIFSFLLLIACLIGQSQTLENESDSTSKSKTTFNNSELGFNLMVSESAGVGAGFYLERKRVNENLTELGLLMAYNNFGDLGLNDELDFKNDHFISLLATAKARGKRFVGLYGGVGGGLVLGIFGGSYQSDGGRSSDAQAEVILRPALLADLGFHLGSFNLGFKTVVIPSLNYPMGMGGINIGFTLK